MMLKLVIAATILFVAVLLPELAAQSSGYCYRLQSDTATRHVSVIAYSSRASYFYTRCGWWNWRRCRRTRYHRVSLTSYRVQFYRTYRSERYCCAGYIQQGTSCIPSCTDNECLHGDCSSDNSRCICDSFWEGEHCDRAICYQPDGCLNGGHCVAPGHCSCAAGYGGDRCERVICEPSCVHGDCSAEGDCVCDPGWDGTACSHEIICLPSCQNGGTCISPGHCACRHGYSGYRCEEQS